MRTRPIKQISLAINTNISRGSAQAGSSVKSNRSQRMVEKVKHSISSKSEANCQVITNLRYLRVHICAVITRGQFHAIRPILMSVGVLPFSIPLIAFPYNCAALLVRTAMKITRTARMTQWVRWIVF